MGKPGRKLFTLYLQHRYDALSKLNRATIKASSSYQDVMLNTAQKIGLAKLAHFVIVRSRRLVGLPPSLVAYRGGVRWQLDLNEGIDFSIFALGGFEPITLRLYRELVHEGDVVFDIGANVGSHTLPLAKIVGGTGRVIAFEPTAFAFSKLQSNLDLNPMLRSQVTCEQTMLVASASESIKPSLFSSWPLNEAEDLHEKHRGRLMSTAGAVSTTLDSYVKDNQLDRVDFIKIDVDGHEPSVIRGSRAMLFGMKPIILMELSPYLYADRMGEFSEMLDVFVTAGYQMVDANNSRSLPFDPNELSKYVPDGGSRNVVLRPSKNMRN